MFVSKDGSVRYYTALLKNIHCPEKNLTTTNALAFLCQTFELFKSIGAILRSFPQTAFLSKGYKQVMKNVKFCVYSTWSHIYNIFFFVTYEWAQ